VESLFGFFIIILIIVFGGGLALLGDRVGMKVGKKRLTLFGLRPKYTSMIITVLTGFFIAGLTLLILTLMSEYVRTAIFELRNIQISLKTTTQKVNLLTKQMVKKEEEYNGLSEKHSQLQVQKEQIEEQLEKVRTEQQKVAKELEMKLKELAAKEKELQAKREEVKVNQERVANLSRIRIDLTNDIINKEAEISRYTQQIENLENRLMQLSDLSDKNQTLISKPMLFLVGEILTAKVVEPGIPADKVFETVIEPMLNEANKIAINRGARIPGKADYALRVTPQRVAEVCAQLSELKDKALVRVVVENNSVAEEPVTATIEVYPNEIVFKNGDVIAETQVVGKTPESTIRDHILSLLILANHKAIERGVDSEDLKDLLSVSEMVKLINEIKADPEATFKIQLVADGDIYRINQFKVKLNLKKM